MTLMKIFASSTSVIRGLRAENAQLRAENAQLKQRLADALGGPSSAAPREQQLSPPAVELEQQPIGWGPVVAVAAANAAVSPVGRPSTPAAGTGSASSSSILPGAEEIKLERRRSLGRLPLPDPGVLAAASNDKNKASVDHIISGVLPLAEAFDRFDVNQSGGLSVDEVRSALEYLGVATNASEQAHKLVMQYDTYPDKVLDVKEFSSLCKDVRMMVQFDENGDGSLDAEELQPALQSIGLQLSEAQIHDTLKAFDIDGDGSIDLLELSSLVRTAKAFMRYDSDKSGTIDHEEMRDALRKLGVRAGSLEAKALFRRYDADESGTIELHEFASLVRDLQLYASYDENLDGQIDAKELHNLLEALGVKVTSHQTAVDLLRAATSTAGAAAAGGAAGATAAATGTTTDEEVDAPPPPPAALGLSRFSTLVHELRIFRTHDADEDGELTLAETREAFSALGLRGTTSEGDDAMLSSAVVSRGKASLVEFIEAVTAATAERPGSVLLVAATAPPPPVVSAILPHHALRDRSAKTLLTA